MNESGNGYERIFVPGDEHDIGKILAQSNRDGAADPTARTGNNRGTVTRTHENTREMRNVSIRICDVALSFLAIAELFFLTAFRDDMRVLLHGSWVNESDVVSRPSLSRGLLRNIR